MWNWLKSNVLFILVLAVIIVLLFVKTQSHKATIGEYEKERIILQEKLDGIR